MSRINHKLLKVVVTAIPKLVFWGVNYKVFCEESKVACANMSSIILVVLRKSCTHWEECVEGGRGCT